MTPDSMPAVVPDRDGEKTALASAVTSIVSVTVASCRVTETSVASPRLTTTPNNARVPKPPVPSTAARASAAAILHDEP